MYFDKASGFLVKTEHRRPHPSTHLEVRWEEFFSAYQEVNPAQREEQALKDAQSSSTNSALLDFLRKQTLSAEVRNKIKAMIRGLGDASFPARQKAKEDLIAQGSTAIPLLTQALKDPDPEVAGLAKECSQKIGKGRDPGVLLAVIRLLAMRKPVGASQVLRDYLPSAPDDAVAQEVRACSQRSAHRTASRARHRRSRDSACCFRVSSARPRAWSSRMARRPRNTN